MRIRVRAPAGTFTLTLPDDATVGDLLGEVTEKTSISQFDIKLGYPPKPLILDSDDKSLPLSKLNVRLDGEQLTISRKDDEPIAQSASKPTGQKITPLPTATKDYGRSDTSASGKAKSSGPVSLQRKGMEGEVPEVPFAERGTTVVLRVMPDDNSCLFRAFGTAILPGDDQSMTELRSIIATTIQGNPEVYSKVVLEQDPDDYCRWIQTPDAWGGAIEMGILAKYFDVDICSIDVQSLRTDHFNEDAQSKCILVYSGIHYDTIVESPSDYPHLKSHNPPDFDKRVWDADDEEILSKAGELCQKLNQMHYFTDTGGMAIKCQICGVIVHGQGQASGHAQQTGHYDMAEITS